MIAEIRTIQTKHGDLISSARKLDVGPKHEIIFSGIVLPIEVIGEHTIKVLQGVKIADDAEVGMSIPNQGSFLSNATINSLAGQKIQFNEIGLDSVDIFTGYSNIRIARLENLPLQDTIYQFGIPGDQTLLIEDRISTGSDSID